MRQNGFTLVELSVVLIIVGLLAGLIVVGRDLIEASVHRKVIVPEDRSVWVPKNASCRSWAKIADSTAADAHPCST